MIKSYIKIALRVITRQKLFALINIFGLSIGLAGTMLLLFYINHETSYDKSFSNADRIFRVTLNIDVDNKPKEVAVTSNILGPTLKDQVPEVQEFVRMLGVGLFNRAIIQKGDDVFSESDLYLADSSVFDLFNVDIIAGKKEDLLDRPGKIVLSRKTAKKYFGDEQAIGQNLKYGDDLLLEVTGIYDDFPSNSHIHPELIISFNSFKSHANLRWDTNNFYTYLLLDRPESMEWVGTKMDDIANENMPDELKAIGFDYNMEPITDIHLLSNTDFNPEAGGDIRYIYALLAVAVFIILIAVFNYMNLSTARSAERAKEVGMRKVMGAYRFNLIVQFLSESFIITLFSILVAIGLVELAKPYFFNLIEQELNISLIHNTKFWVVLLSGSLAISLVSGSYPAFAISSFSPVNILKGIGSKGTGSGMRKGLVILQFTISAALIFGTFVVYKQLFYMQQKKLGFDKENVLIISTTSDEIHKNVEGIRSALTAHNNIFEVSSTSAYPGRNSGGMIFHVEGMEEGEQTTVWEWRVDEHLVKTMGFKLLQGRDFHPSDRESEELEFIINQAAVETFGWDEEDCIGRSITMGAGSGICIGVVENFHFNSLKQHVEPMALCMREGFHQYLVVKMGDGNVNSTIRFIETEWKKFTQNQPFNYYFLSHDFDNLYKNERKISQIILIFAIFTVIISCLGLFGLSSYAAIQRTKEIGIRKVMGSSVIQILILFVRDNLKLIFISLLIALPLGYFAMDKWLSGFAYRIQGVSDLLIISALTVIMVAILTVIFHAIRAANTNPVDSLRYE